MVANFVIVECEPQDHYCVALKEDDTIWSFDCSHLHHSADVTRKCLARTRKRWAPFETSERKMIDSAKGFVELRSGIVTIRMRPMPEWIEVA